MIRDKAHLARVRQHPCLNCRTDQNIEAHHLLRAPGSKRGVGLKTGDNWTIPLCNRCHSGLHWVGDEIKFFGEVKREEAVSFAARLWGMTGKKRGSKQ